MNLNDDEAQRVIDQLSKKVNFINSDFRHSQIIKSVISNLGKQNFLASLLMNGLKDKNKLSSDYPLTRQRAFLDEATRGLRDQLAKENYKFDDEKSIQTAFESHIFLDTEINQILSSFQANVYKKATRSKEKNLDLIKAWAKEHKLEDSPIYSDLAELIKNNGSLFKTK